MNKEILITSKVTVVDLGNYKTEAQEPVPFEAYLAQITEYPMYWVQSVNTGKEYELYCHQIKELQEE